MDYSPWYFSEIGQFLKMAKTQKLLVGISLILYLLHSKRKNQYVSKNVIKIRGEFEAIFQKKAWAIVQGIF